MEFVSALSIPSGPPLPISFGFKTGTLPSLVSSLVPNGNIAIQNGTGSGSTSSTGGSAAWMDVLTEGLGGQNRDTPALVGLALPRFALALSSLTRDGAAGYGPAEAATPGSSTASATALL